MALSRRFNISLLALLVPLASCSNTQAPPARLISDAESQMLAEIKTYIASGGDLNKYWLPPGYSGGGHVPQTRLKFAATSGYVETVKFLLDHGADPNFTGNSSAAWTAMHWAASPEIAQLLKDRGGDVRYFERGQWSIQPIHVAAMKGRAAVIQWLIAQGVSCKEVTSEGETPLHFAADAGTAKVLLMAGADVNARTINTSRTFVNADGSMGGSGSTSPKYATPLLYAVRNNRIEVVRFLLDAGADLDISSTLGTPHELAVARGYKEIAELIAARAATRPATNPGAPASRSAD